MDPRAIANQLCDEADDLLAGIGPTPHRHCDFALQHQVVGGESGRRDIGAGGDGAEDHRGENVTG